MQAQDAPDGSPDPRLVGQFAMRYDYVAKVHRAICVVQANGTFSVSVATLAGRSPIRSGSVALPFQKYRHRTSQQIWCKVGKR